MRDALNGRFDLVLADALAAVDARIVDVVRTIGDIGREGRRSTLTEWALSAPAKPQRQRPRPRPQTTTRINAAAATGRIGAEVRVGRSEVWASGEQVGAPPAGRRSTPDKERSARIEESRVDTHVARVGVGRERRCACGAGYWDLGRQAEMPQDSFNDARLFD